MQLCEKVVRMELMPDDLIKEAEEVDSTTEDSPVKKRPKVVKKPGKSVLKSSALAKIEAAKMRADKIFASTPSQLTVSLSSDSDSDSDAAEIARLRKQVRELEKKASSTSAAPQLQEQPFSTCEC